MRVWELTQWGRTHLQHVRREPPAVATGQVRLRMRAASLNYRDHLMVEGHYDRRVPLPLVPVSDGVGVIEALGAGVEGLAVGDRVCPTFAPSWLDGAPDADAARYTRGGAVPGVMADQVVVAASAVVPVPAYLTDVQAATLPCAALTAWSALRTLGQLRPGETVLTLGTGGVSLFAVQLAVSMGARVVATTSSAPKETLLRELGASEVVRYPDDPEWGRTVHRLTDGGVDHVVEVGGAGTLPQSLQAVRVGGTVSLIGVLAGGRSDLSVLPILMKQIRVQGVLVGSRAGLLALGEWLDGHRIAPVLDRTFRFAQLPEALAHLAVGAHIGKVTLTY